MAISTSPRRRPKARPRNSSLAPAINVGRIEEVDARIQCRVYGGRAVRKQLSGFFPMMQRLFDLAVQIWRIFQLVLELLPSTRRRRWFTVNRLRLFRTFDFRFGSLFNFFRAFRFKFRAYVKYRFICHFLSPFTFLEFRD